MNSQGDSCILLFTKCPVNRQVKTRLAAHIGQQAARRLYEVFVLDTLALLEAMNVPLRICFDPLGAEEQIKQWLGGKYSYVAQTGEDLGQRMKNAFVHSFEEGFNKVILIGSDIPDVPREYLSSALKALEAHDVVVGPSSDGGYYLIGFAKMSFLPVAFDDISWSTPAVCKQTTETLTRHKLNVFLLPEWHDLDTPSDLEMLIARNRDTAFAESRTAALIRDIEAGTTG